MEPCFAAWMGATDGAEGGAMPTGAMGVGGGGPTPTDAMGGAMGSTGKGTGVIPGTLGALGEVRRS